MELRKQQEKEFHDKIRTVRGDTQVTATRWSPELEYTIKTNPLWRNMKYYSIEKKSRDMVLNWFKENCRGKRVLDYCCGNGEDGIFIAQNGAREVIGIDISDVSIENCRISAKKHGVQPITSYYIRDAEATGFPDNYFDVITEYGALHHLDLEKAFAEMQRLIKPDGKIICNEALGHNLLIHLYRKFTPSLRTSWEVEHIMRKKDFKVAARYFEKIDIYFYHLFTLGAVPFRKTGFFPALLNFLEKLDKVVLDQPFFKWQAWQAVFVLSQPKKAA